MSSQKSPPFLCVLTESFAFLHAAANTSAFSVRAGRTIKSVRICTRNCAQPLSNDTTSSKISSESNSSFSSDISAEIWFNVVHSLKLRVETVSSGLRLPCRLPGSQDEDCQNRDILCGFLRIFWTILALLILDVLQ